MNFNLEIYEPGSESDCWVTFDLETPVAIHKGDFLRTGAWEGEQMHSMVVVDKVEHLIFTAGSETTHKLMVFVSRVR